MNTDSYTGIYAEESQIENPVKTVDEQLPVHARLTSNARDGILPARYFRKNADGDVLEDAADMFYRVAENVAGAEVDEPEREEWTEEFYHQMSTLRFVPNSPTLMNAATDMNQLSACFVLEPRDDMDDIFETAKQAALVFQSGGGVGYSFSDLRPKGSYINSTGGEASGPVSFMRVFDETCNQVKQGGKRRGAQMAILRADHPDVGRFAVSKRKEGELSNFNISVGYTDEFIEAVKSGDTYTLYDPTSDYETPYEVREATAYFYNAEYQDNPRDAYDDGEGAIVSENLWRDYADQIQAVDGRTLREKWEGEISLEVGEPMELPAEFLWDILVDGGWRNGEPGLFNFSETNRQHSFDTEKHPEHRMNATNPCAEQMLEEYEACNLGHINLSLMLREDAPTYREFVTRHAIEDPTMMFTHDLVREYFYEAMDFDDLNRTIEAGTRFLDNVVTQSDFPIPEITEKVNGMRKIGLGIMGFAQLLYQMGIPYGTQDSYMMAERVMEHIDRAGTQVSHELAHERGSFAYWSDSKYATPQEYPEWFESHTGLDPSEYPNGYPIRNHSITTIAPTGTTSKIGNTSGGCEPVFSVCNFANVGNDIQGDDVLVEFDDYFLRTLEANNIDSEAVKEEAEDLMRNNEFENVGDLSIPAKLADLFVTTNDLSPRQHGLMQRSFQKYCDSGISKTVNLPNEATHEDVADAYRLALSDDERGAVIKGLTVYRDGSRQEQVLTTRMDNKLDEDDEDDDLCPECGEAEIEDTDDCALCPNCYYSPCS